MAREPNQLHAVTIECAACDPGGFRRWRASVHNTFAYRRRSNRWWGSAGIWGWGTGAGLRGIVALGALTTIEFMVALRRLGEIRLRPLEIENVRIEVYAATKLVSLSPSIKVAGRYQSVKIAIEPVIVAASTGPIVSSRMIAPMAMIV